MLLGWPFETRSKRQINLDHPGTTKQLNLSNVKRLMKHCVCKEKDTKHKVKRQQEWTLLLRTSLKEFNKTVTLRGGRETEFSFGFFLFHK